MAKDIEIFGVGKKNSSLKKVTQISPASPKHLSPPTTFDQFFVWFKIKSWVYK